MSSRIFFTLFVAIVVCCFAGGVLAQTNFTTGLRYTVDAGQSIWTNASGSGTGVDPWVVDLCPTIPLHTIDVTNVVADPMVAMMHPFRLVPPAPGSAFWTYWNSKGVNAGAAPGTWQWWMWQIINGNADIFYLVVTPGPPVTYQLIDGLQYQASGGTIITPFVVNGDYPVGTYVVNGSLLFVAGLSQVTYTIQFQNQPPVFSTGLRYTTDEAMTLWAAAGGSGTPAGPFTVNLCPPRTYHTLDVMGATFSYVDTGQYGFYLTAHPGAAFFTWWAARGVTAGALPGTWQAWMWQIINGSQPIFYLDVNLIPTPTVQLIDGLQRDFLSNTQPFVVNGDYPPGLYTVSGGITNSCGLRTSLIYTIQFFACAIAVDLSSFSASCFDGQVNIEWTTESEVNTAGYNLYRSDREEGEYVRLNATLIPGLGSATKGSSYSYIDKPAPAAVYFYKLEDVGQDGVIQFFGPVSVDVTTPVATTDALPKNYHLSQNFPNPFNPSTRIDFAVPNEKFVTIKVYNVHGRLVRTLISETLSAGTHSVVWDRTDDSGAQVPSGLYVYQMKAGSFSQSCKLIVLK
ncbi:T9SS type A sorting domain-containing protein [candidate division KSB1 bacterium]|nr:T9SS type A sorting domain-containing protein [candidate division KSB1 bacterium]